MKISRSTAEKLKQLIANRGGGDQGPGYTPAITGNAVFVLMSSADTGNLLQYADGDWESGAEVTVLEANDGTLEAGLIYLGLLYADDIAIVTSDGDGSGSGSGQCGVPRCNTIKLPKYWTVEITIDDVDCPGGTFILAHQGDFVWSYEDPSYSLTFEFFGKTQDPQCQLDIELKDCDQSFSYAMELDPGANCLILDLSPDSPTDTVDYATWVAGGAFEIGTWTVAVWNRGDRVGTGCGSSTGDPMGLWAWIEGEPQGTLHSDIDTTNIEISGGFATREKAVGWAVSNYASGTLDNIWISPIDDPYRCCGDATEVVDSYGSFSGTLDPYATLYDLHPFCQVWSYPTTVADLANYMSTTGLDSDGNYYLFEPVLCCFENNTDCVRPAQGIQGWDAFYWTEVSSNSWIRAGVDFVGYPGAMVVGPILMPSGDSIAERNLWYNWFYFSYERRDYWEHVINSCPCPSQFCSSTTVEADCCSSNTLLLASEDLGGIMPAELTLDPSANFVWVSYPVSIDGGAE